MRNGKSATIRRPLCWQLAGLLALAGFAYLAPQWCWVWIGSGKHAHYYQGRPTSYWRAVLRNSSPGWEQFIPTRLHRSLGLGGMPAVLQHDPAAVPVLLDLLKDNDMQVRWTALFSLSETPHLPAGVPEAILPLLADENAEFRSFAAQRLATICSDETLVVPALLPLLADENVAVRRSIVNTLGQFGPKSKKVLAVLGGRLRDPSEHPSVRSSAAYGLGNLGQPAVPVLRDALEDQEAEVRVAAATALWRSTKQAAPLLPILVPALTHPDVRIREQAVHGLARIDPSIPEVVSALVQALADSEPRVRWPACGALASIHWTSREQARAVIQPLTRLVRDEKHDATLRAAIRALGHIGPEAASAVPFLTALLERPDQTLRAEVAQALGEIGSGAKEAVPALLAIYQRGTAPFADRQAVITALHRIDPESAARNNIP
jgi:HEAT repeat protein